MPELPQAPGASACPALLYLQQERRSQDVPPLEERDQIEMTKRARRRELLGRKITDVEWRRRFDGEKWITDPRITLDHVEYLTIETIETADGTPHGYWLVLTDKHQ